MVVAKNLSTSEVKELPKWKKIEETNVEITLKRFIAGKEVVSKQELISLWGKSAKTIQRYISDGMPMHKVSTRAFQVFDIEEATAWRDGSIDKVKSQKTSSRQTEMEIDISDDGDESELVALTDMERKLKADADKAEHDAVIADLKKQKEEGSLISTKELKNTLADLTTVFMTLYMNDKKLLPVQLQNKTINEMRDYLDLHYAKRIEDLRRYVELEFEGSEESLHDVIYKILEQLRDGLHIDDLLKKIEK